MADDSLEILEDHAFHPADPPDGMRNYDLGSLRPSQQRTLNKLKMIQRVENENYLKAHPEIKGLISILLRHVLYKKPFTKVHEAAGSFFTRPVHKIVSELMDYLMENGYSGPVIDTLRKEIARCKKENSTDDEGSFASRKFSLKSTSSKNPSESLTEIYSKMKSE